MVALLGILKAGGACLPWTRPTPASVSRSCSAMRGHGVLLAAAGIEALARPAD